MCYYYNKNVVIIYLCNDIMTYNAFIYDKRAPDSHTTELKIRNFFRTF